MSEGILVRIGGISTYFKRIINALFPPNGDGVDRWVDRAWLAGLYLFGATVWGFFFNWGRIAFDLHDWNQEGPRFEFIRQALLQGKLPLHIGSELASTERFLAIPDTVISPQIFLLRFLSPATFVLVNSLFLYTLGFVGLLLLRRKYQWSAITFSFVFVLCSLNGHPIAQMAVGHSMWISYFLMPFFVLLVLSLVEGQVGWKWVTCMAVLLLGIHLQGGYHFANWALMFLLVLGLTSRRFLAPVLKAIVFSVLVSLPRILPAAIEWGSAEKRSFISGFFSVTDMVSAFIRLKPPEEALSGMYSALGWWEVDNYIGLLGLVFILVFGVYHVIKHAADHTADYVRLLGAVLVMSVLSLGKVFQPVTALPLPLVDAERVSSRFVIVPLLILIVLGGVAFDRFLRGRTWGFGSQVAALIFFGVITHDLLQHARYWRVENMANLFPRTAVDIRAEVLVRNDPAYFSALLIGMGIALLTLVFLVWMIRREKPNDVPAVN